MLCVGHQDRVLLFVLVAVAASVLDVECPPRHSGGIHFRDPHNSRGSQRHRSNHCSENTTDTLGHPHHPNPGTINVYGPHSTTWCKNEFWYDTVYEIRTLKKRSQTLLPTYHNLESAESRIPVKGIACMRLACVCLQGRVFTLIEAGRHTLNWVAALTARMRVFFSLCSCRGCHVSSCLGSCPDFPSVAEPEYKPQKPFLPYVAFCQNVLSKPQKGDCEEHHHHPRVIDDVLLHFIPKTESFHPIAVFPGTLHSTQMKPADRERKEKKPGRLLV
jgi:hypothetical protein